VPNAAGDIGVGAEAELRKPRSAIAGIGQRRVDLSDIEG